MMSGIDRAMAYRTMRAVEEANQQSNPRPPRRGLWARWRAWLDRTADRLLR
jgi:hypothetical protein